MLRSYWFCQVHTDFKDSWLKNNVRVLDIENIYISCKVEVANSFRHSFPNL